MSSPKPQGRQLDGPIRRPRISPAAASAPPDASIVIPSVMPTEPRVQKALAPRPEALDSVEGFEYRKPRAPRAKRIGKWIALAIIVIGVGFGLFFGFKTLLAARRIISKHSGDTAPGLSASIDPTTLKGEGQGRINILLLGVGGGDHDGTALSDTIMVASLDPKTKDVALLSIPRDLYVQIKSGEYAKINEANSVGGPDLAKKVVQKVLGVPIHYYVLVDFSGFKQAVDAVGGIDINVKQRLDDAEYPCDYNQFKVCGYHQAVGKIHMNGTTALKYARCRKGSCGDDYGRAARQQEVLVAVRMRALQLSTLTNPVKLASLIDTVGSHVKTDLQLKEIQKLALIAKEVDSSKIVNKVLSDAADNYLQIGPASFNAGSILVPKAGNFDYSDIRDFVKNIFADHYLIAENARVEVQNGTNTAGLASRVVQSLQAAHYNVLPPSTAAVPTSTTVIYDYSGGRKPVTINYLKARFNCSVVTAAAPSVSPTSSSGQNSASPTPVPEIRVILGSDYRPTSTSPTTGANSSNSN